MFNNFIKGIVGGISYVLYFKRPKSVYDTFIKNYVRRWKRIKLKIMVEEQNTIFVYLKSLREVANIVLGSVYNYVSGFGLTKKLLSYTAYIYHTISEMTSPSDANVEMVSDTSYIVTYILNKKTYKMFVEHARGPSKILHITNENNKDITDIVLPYLGPNFDWHGTDKPLTPKFFNCEKIFITDFNFVTTEL